MPLPSDLLPYFLPLFFHIYIDISPVYSRRSFFFIPLSFSLSFSVRRRISTESTLLKEGGGESLSLASWETLSQVRFFLPFFSFLFFTLLEKEKGKIVSRRFGDVWNGSIGG